MISKRFTILFSVMFIQTITGQYIRNPYNAGYRNELFDENLAYSQAYGTANALAYGPTAANALAYGAANLNAMGHGPTPANPVAYAPADVAYEIPHVQTGLNYGLSLAELSASNGGDLRIRSSSSIPASGVTVETDNMLIEGPLAVSGQLPFLGVVALEGPLPAAGAGSVAYGCGNGNVGIISEGVEQPSPAYPDAYPGYPSGPYMNGLPGFGLSPGSY